MQPEADRIFNTRAEAEAACERLNGEHGWPRFYLGGPVDGKWWVLRAPREFRDGDRVVVSFRLEGGEIAELETEYSGIYGDGEDGVTYLEYYLYRPDSATDWIPLDQVVGLRLIQPRDRDEDDW
jgi:hypothetical protein